MGIMDRERFNWASSKTAGRITEVAVLAPVKRGCIPNERRTFEERAMAVVENFAARIQQGLPNELNLVPNIHFGRITLIRPEHYLLNSQITGVEYETVNTNRPGDPDRTSRVPKPIDEYTRVEANGNVTYNAGDDLQLRSFLLTTVEFDGDLRVYFRDIGIELNRRFDLIFENCEDFPGTADFEAFWLWIRRYQINTQLFYSAYANLSVVRIKQLEAFKQSFDQFVARVRSPTGARVRSMDDLFDEFLRENQQFASGFPGPGGVFRRLGQQEDGR